MIDIKRSIKRIADYYKTKHQEQKFVEEVGELLVEIGKNMITNTVSNNTPSEMADVTSLMFQLVYLYDIEDEFRKQLEYKIDRQIKRIDRRTPAPF